MTDTEVTAAATLVAAFGGVVLGAVLAWLGGTQPAPLRGADAAG
jgi:hypothetical protein